MFKQTKNIDTAFRYIKTFTLLMVVGCFFLCGYVLYKSYELSARVQDKIYILSGDKAMEAFLARLPRAVRTYILTASRDLSSCNGGMFRV